MLLLKNFIRAFNYSEGFLCNCTCKYCTLFKFTPLLLFIIPSSLCSGFIILFEYMHIMYCDHINLSLPAPFLLTPHTVFPPIVQLLHSCIIIIVITVYIKTENLGSLKSDKSPVYKCTTISLSIHLLIST
jgi:hypothetical protein